VAVTAAMLLAANGCGSKKVPEPTVADGGMLVDAFDVGGTRIVCSWPY
jgi:hypothetical protein